MLQFRGTTEYLSFTVKLEQVALTSAACSFCNVWGVLTLMSVLMEWRFQEGPAGHSHFHRHHEHNPPPRARGSVGNYRSCVFREESDGESGAGGGIMTKRRAPISSSSDETHAEVALQQVPNTRADSGHTQSHRCV